MKNKILILMLIMMIFILSFTIVSATTHTMVGEQYYNFTSKEVTNTTTNGCPDFKYVQEEENSMDSCSGDFYSTDEYNTCNGTLTNLTGSVSIPSSDTNYCFKRTTESNYYLFSIYTNSTHAFLNDDPDYFRSMITKWTTEEDNQTITLPLYSGGTFNFTVDWGDNSSDNITSYNQAEVNHTYTATGTYTVELIGVIDGWSFKEYQNSGANLFSGVDQWGDVKLANNGEQFYNVYSMYINASDILDTSSLTNMSGLFNNAGLDVQSSINNWNTSSVTDMSYAFKDNAVSDFNISSWDVSSVTNMNHMFSGAEEFNCDISSWDVSSVTDSSYMFNGAVNFNKNISSWNTSNIINMEGMFLSETNFNQPLNDWDVSKVTNMRYMFNQATNFNQPLNDWDVSKVTNMRSLFHQATNFNQNLSSWNTSSATNMRYMFNQATYFNQDLSSWDLSKVTTMQFFLDDTNFSTNNYNKLLLSLSQQSLQSNVEFSVGDTKYDYSYDDERQSIIDNYSWTITDGGTTNVAPTINNVDILPEILTTRSSLIGECTVIDNNDGQQLNVSYKWYKNDVLVNSIENISVVEGTTVTSSYGETLNQGDGWIFSCESTDGLTSSGWQNSTVKTVTTNTPPENPNAYIQTPLQDTDNLIGICNAHDSNNDTMSMNYITYKNGVEFSSGTTTGFVSDTNKTVVTISSNNVVTGDNWTISCQSDDGLATSDYSNSSIYIVQRNPVPPVSNYVQIRPLILLENETVSVTALGTDANLDDINYTFKLYVNDVVVETKTNNSNTQNTQVSVVFDYSTLANADTVKIGMIMTDIDNTSIEYYSNTLIVRATNNVPSITSVRTDPNIVIGQDDNVVGYCNSTDLDGDTVNYNYIWYVNNISVKTGSKIYSNYYGYTQGEEILIDTISESYYEEGDYLIFSCQVYDAKNESVFVNDTTRYIYGNTNFAPTIEEIYVEPIGTQNTLVDFNISINASDVDSSQLKYEWRFVKNSAYQTTTTSDWKNANQKSQVGTLDNEDTIAGDVYYVRARAYDGEQYSDWYNSNTVIISNTKPQMQISNITTSPLEDTALQSYCTASDIDTEQTLTFTKTWYKNGVSSYNGDTLPASVTQEGEQWILGCVANDGTDDSDELNSTAVTIIGTSNIPIIDNISLTGSNNILTAKCLSSDADGDIIDYTFKLYKNDVLINTSTRNGIAQNVEQIVYYTPAISDNDEFIFSCETNDNEDGSSGFSNSTTLVIPEITFNHVVSSTTATTFTVEWSTNADEIEVYLDNVLQVITTLNGWKFENLQPNTLYNVKLIPVKDNFKTTSTLFNVTTEVSDNNPPVMEQVFIKPSSVYTETAVTGHCRATDLESYNLYYTYTWKVNNVSVDTGVTSLYERGTNVTVGVLTSSNYQFNDTITLECTAYDSITNTGVYSANVTVLNTEPVVQDELIMIELNGDKYVCDHTYTDADGDPEQNYTIKWFVNDIEQSNNSVVGNDLLMNGTVVNDEIVCQINTGDAYHNITKNSSTFLVGDFEDPAISNVIMPTSVYSDDSYLISTVCTDNVGVANNYPKIRFINPNYVEEEYPFYYEGSNTYQRYHTFNIPGEYTNIEIECRDGNGNKKIYKYNGTVLSLLRETVINVGGSGGTSEEPEDFRNITSFELIPTSQSVQISAGSTKIMEFEVINNDIVDIQFTSAILRTSDPQVYDWMSFNDEYKAINFAIQKENGLSSNSKFIRYTITVPKDTPTGTYKGVIEVNGMEQTETFNVEIKVTKSTIVKVLSVLQEPLFELPFSMTASTTGAVIGTTGKSGTTPVTPVTLIIVTSIAGLGVFGFRRLKAL